MKKLKAIVMALVVAAACGPVNNPQSPDYPCGPRGVVCAQHECCWKGDECGGAANGSISCPEHMCCFVGDPTADTVSSRPKRYPAVHVP